MENEREEISSQVESNKSEEQLNKEDNPPAEKMAQIKEDNPPVERIVYIKEDNPLAEKMAHIKEDNSHVEKIVYFGVLLGLLGLIGLVIGLCLYTEKSERESFIKGWVIMFVIEIFVCIIFGILYANKIRSAYDDIINNLNNIY